MDGRDAGQARVTGNGHGKSLEIDALPGVVGQLLPTPNTMDHIGARSPEALARAKERGGCSNLKDVTDFGPYTAAINRWEQVIGRPAPSPTEPGNSGRPRLSPRFVEWLMGLTDGWVTGVPGITRSAALKALGNGVVPQQAALALEIGRAHV